MTAEGAEGAERNWIDRKDAKEEEGARIMGENSSIEWCTHTFNPWVGCSKVDAGCKHCYAEALMDKRYGKVQWGDGGARVRTGALNWAKPLAWNRKAEEEKINFEIRSSKLETNSKSEIRDEDENHGRDARATWRRPRVFCASLADVFEDRPELAPWRNDLSSLIWRTPWLEWLILTKRPENALRTLSAHGIGGPDGCAGIVAAPNVRIGTSVSDQASAEKRIPELLKIPCPNFVSYEPALGEVDFGHLLERFRCPRCRRVGPRDGFPMNPRQGYLECTCGQLPNREGVDWLICGGESGLGARPFNLEWARTTRDVCRFHQVPFFMKQLGAKCHFRDDGPKDSKKYGSEDDPEIVAEALAEEFEHWHRLALRDPKGGDMSEWPEDLRVREFPW